MLKARVLSGAVVAFLMFSGASSIAGADAKPEPDPQISQQLEQIKGPNAIPPVYTREVINKSKVSNSYVNRSNRLGSCTVGSTGSVCTISRTESATRSIDLSLGITRGAVSASLGISAAQSVSTAVSCTSPAMNAGQTWSAYPRGDRWSYNVRKKTILGGSVVNTETSGTLYAFNPRANDVYCTL